jgi:hypothetical protein
MLSVVLCKIHADLMLKNVREKLIKEWINM